MIHPQFRGLQYDLHIFLVQNGEQVKIMTIADTKINFQHKLYLNGYI